MIREARACIAAGRQDLQALEARPDIAVGRLFLGELYADRVRTDESNAGDGGFQLSGEEAMMNLNGQQSAVDEATQAWIAAFNEHDAEKVAALYHPEAVLWGTVSSVLITSPDGIRGYFERNFQLSPPPNTSIGERRTRTYGDTAMSSGYYSFERVVEGQVQSIAARFSFTYRRVGDQWLIVDHHSSLLPSKPPAAQ